VGEGGERVEAEFADLAAQQVIQPRAGDAELLCGFGLIDIINSERSVMLMASASVASSANQTLSNFSIFITSLLCNLTETGCCKRYVTLRGFLSLLVEGMQHVDHCPYVGHVDDAEFPRPVRNPDFAHPFANCRHRLPINGIIAFLHTLKLKTCIPPCIIGKIPEAFTGIA
jgi:hypothetical protein